jgi:hypothetical protein
VGRAKTFRRLAQLAGSRGVLGIEYDKEFTAHQRQGDIERAGFGPWPARGRDDDLVGGGQIQGLDGEPRRAIVVLDPELDVELAARIVDRGKRGGELRHDPGFPVQRDHDRINR